MPRISASTVAEHRANQERLLLDIAHAILEETGEVPTMGQISKRAGLARSTMYQYFDSRDALVNALVQDIFPKWTQRVTNAMSAAPTPGGRILAYAIANVQLVAEGAHAIGTALETVSPSDALNEQAALMHHKIQEPLTSTLFELEVADPEGIGELVNAVVHASTRLLETGTALDQVCNNLEAVLEPMCREMDQRSRSTTEA